MVAFGRVVGGYCFFEYVEKLMSELRFEFGGLSFKLTVLMISQLKHRKATTTINYSQHAINLLESK